jgi:hypothetical protein
MTTRLGVIAVTIGATAAIRDSLNRKRTRNEGADDDAVVATSFVRFSSALVANQSLLCPVFAIRQLPNSGQGDS